MLSSITPLGERSRHNHWGLTVASFTTSGALAGAAAGATLGLLGALTLDGVSARGRLAGLAGVLVAAALTDLLAGSLPGPRRQVNERWLEEYRGWVYGAGFGAQLGVGVVTIISSATLYAAFIAALLTAVPADGATVVGSFGAMRGLSLLPAATVRNSESLWRLHRRLRDWSGRSRRLGSALALLLAAGAFAVAG